MQSLGTQAGQDSQEGQELTSDACSRQAEGNTGVFCRGKDEVEDELDFGLYSYQENGSDTRCDEDFDASLCQAFDLRVDEIWGFNIPSEDPEKPCELKDLTLELSKDSHPRQEILVQAADALKLALEDQLRAEDLEFDGGERENALWSSSSGTGFQVSFARRPEWMRATSLEVEESEAPLSRTGRGAHGYETQPPGSK
ncbi:hypothetical protein HWI79_3685 [Cryptosporidium felis]|nr:hypothetical protein HWI79_3685 [Cryptosporidium felis]